MYADGNKTVHDLSNVGASIQKYFVMILVALSNKGKTTMVTYLAIQVQFSHCRTNVNIYVRNKVLKAKIKNTISPFDLFLTIYK